MSISRPKVKEFELSSEFKEEFGFIRAYVIGSYLTLDLKSGERIRCEFDSRKLPIFKKKLENAIAANLSGVEFDSNFDSRKFSTKFIDLLVQDAENEHEKLESNLRRNRTISKKYSTRSTRIKPP